MSLSISKRGPKVWSPSSSHLMPVDLIAKSLGISVRTVNYDLCHAYRKLRRDPEMCRLFQEVR